MPVRIGAAENTFANPIGLLSDCHRRIEGSLQTLLTVAAERAGGPLDAEHRRALEAALKYFREAAPKHTEDEEEDLFPALRRLENPRVLKILSDVEQLEKEHVTADQWHREVDQIGECWLRQNRLSEEEAARLQDLLRSLSVLYSSHIALEEQEVFPAARAELSGPAKEAIGRKMAARRGVPFIPEWVGLKELQP